MTAAGTPTASPCSFSSPCQSHPPAPVHRHVKPLGPASTADEKVDVPDVHHHRVPLGPCAYLRECAVGGSIHLGTRPCTTRSKMFAHLEAEEVVVEEEGAEEEPSPRR